MFVKNSSLLIYLFFTACIKTVYSSSSSESNVYEYDFYLTWEMSMTYTDSDGIIWDVTLDEGNLYYTPNLTRLELKKEDVVTLDGEQNKFIAINGQYPGPTIEVPLGAAVLVRVFNNLVTDSASVHWHGLNMRASNSTGGFATPWADGVAYVTQCPISPGETFTYKFAATQAGTFWYHSHLGMQKLDGFFGAVIVHDPTMPSYPSFFLLVNDFVHMDATEFALNFAPVMHVENKPKLDACAYPYGAPESALTNLPAASHLVNGRGRFENNTAPLEIHKVEQGQEYMFRITNAGFDDVFEFCIDDHLLTVVGVDSCEVEPVEVVSVFLAPGERVNVMVKMDQQPGNYWVRYRAPDFVKTTFGYSILSYTNSTADPTTSPEACTADLPCKSLNGPFIASPNWEAISIHKLRSTRYHLAEIDKIRGNADNIVEKFYSFSSLKYYAINGRSLVLPQTNLYQDPSAKTGVTCNDQLCDNFSCRCTYIEKLPTKHTIQMVIMHSKSTDCVHSWHMHGYRFAVLKIFYPVNGPDAIANETDITCSNDLCHDAKWVEEELGHFEVEYPPMKDNLLIPVGGYAVIRIYTDNPGYWLAHCHQDTHLYMGMGMIFDIDGESAEKTIPSNFPVCGDFILD